MITTNWEGMEWWLYIVKWKYNFSYDTLDVMFQIYTHNDFISYLNLIIRWH